MSRQQRLENIQRLLIDVELEELGVFSERGRQIRQQVAQSERRVSEAGVKGRQKDVRHDWESKSRGCSGLSILRGGALLRAELLRQREADGLAQRRSVSSKSMARGPLFTGHCLAVFGISPQIANSWFPRTIKGSGTRAKATPMNRRL